MPSGPSVTFLRKSSTTSSRADADRLQQWRLDRAARQDYEHRDTMEQIVSPSTSQSPFPSVHNPKNNISAHDGCATWRDVAASQSMLFDASSAVKALDHRSLVAIRDATMRRRITEILVKHHQKRVHHAVTYHDERAEVELRKLQKEAEAARCLMSSRQQKNRKGENDSAKHEFQQTGESSLSRQLVRTVSRESSELPPLVTRQRLTPKPSGPSLSPELKEILYRNRRAATPPFTTQTHPEEWTTLPPRLRSPTESTPALRRFMDDSCDAIEAEMEMNVKTAQEVRRRDQAHDLHRRQFALLQSRHHNMTTPQQSNSRSPPSSQRQSNEPPDADASSSAALMATARSGGSSLSPLKTAGDAAKKNTSVVVVAASVPSTAQIAAVDAVVRKPRAAGAPNLCSFSYWDTVNAMPQLKNRRK
ncbi:Hypothetical protein, putative [Bodo saltans]|uniref:Uncharacterized protein n=1 Tax=Bodo saltans TaxID=75058 RepID=A0A0S4J974_BODSA|nr:Hypothetical protein, putative [Bodo saltans]|eukprot:CUG74928.1 Hypothetical protein, putative [Bodo saltans]